MAMVQIYYSLLFKRNLLSSLCLETRLDLAALTQKWCLGKGLTRSTTLFVWAVIIIQAIGGNYSVYSYSVVFPSVSSSTVRLSWWYLILDVNSLLSWSDLRQHRWLEVKIYCTIIRSVVVIIPAMSTWDTYWDWMYPALLYLMIQSKKPRAIAFSKLGYNGAHFSKPC